MVDALVGSMDVTVLGGPATVDVGLDFGPSGDRGSYFFVGNGNPNTPGTVIGQTPKVQDMYINLLTSDPEYLFLYQYQYVNGSNVWVRLVKLIPNHYSESVTRSFENGELNFFIPVGNIVASNLIANITSSNLSVQHSIVNNANPVTSTLIIGNIVTTGGVVSLPITIKAKEFDGTDWIDLDGNARIDLFISVV
jgi:hypothetical protein